ncbi:MAG TPA: DUF1667 domain-containing protein [Sedimentibacter sp.]|jgi:CxxC motif-containing protein|nr:DUF1667 domain-containing protein [Sedimentibacter sp.]
MKKEIICTICPIGCTIIVEGDVNNIFSISGNQCSRGLDFSKNEFLHPARILTTSVKVENSSTPLLPVRSNKPIPKELIMDCMKVIKDVKVTVPIKSKDIIISNICDSGADIIATACID